MASGVYVCSHFKMLFFVCTILHTLKLTCFFNCVHFQIPQLIFVESFTQFILYQTFFSALSTTIWSTEKKELSMRNIRNNDKFQHFGNPKTKKKPHELNVYTSLAPAPVSVSVYWMCDTSLRGTCPCASGWF